jgi:hypothetical protein
VSVTVRPLDLTRDKALILRMLERNIGIAQDESRFDWLYRRNPAGRAWAWALHDEHGTPVGSASVFPRMMWVGERVVRCGQVGHFSVDTGYRSLGPAVMLQRTTLELPARGDVNFCYDCPPHDQGMATFRRLGIDETCVLRRHIRPVRARRYITRALGNGPAARGMTTLADCVLRLRPRRRVPRGVDVARHEVAFDKEFSVLDERVGGRFGVRGQRTAEILNWRFREDPSFHYDVFTARRDGELVAFAVVRLSEPDARVVDLFGVGDVDVEAALLGAAVEEARARDVDVMHALMCPGHPAEPALALAGFSRREVAIRIVAYGAAPDASTATVPARGERWAVGYAEYMG